MGSLPFVLEVVLPRSGAVPPNSPIVLMGHIQGQLAVTARASGVDLGVVLEEPPAFGPHAPGTYRTWLVRPAAGEWPAGATVVLTAVREPQEPAVIEIPIAEGRDVSPPVFSSMSLPERKVFGGPRQPSREVVVLAHQGFTDDASPLILVTLEAGGAVLRGTTLEGMAGGLPMPPGGARALDAITLADLAGNSVRIANPCTEATAPTSPPPIAAFACVAGTLVAEDGWFVGTTDAGTENGFSRGHYRATSAPDGDLAISVTATRLTDEPAMPIEIAFRGGFFGVTSTSLWYLYEHDGHWTGWKPTPSPVGSDPLRLRVVQRGAEVQAFVNGAFAGSLTLEKPTAGVGPVGVFFKGPPGATARMRFRDFVAEPPPMTRTLTMLLLPAGDPDELDAMGAEERREQCGARKKIQLLHEGEPDVLVRQSLDIDQGVYGAAKVAEEAGTQETSAIFYTEVESAAELLKPHLADPLALAERFIEHAASGEDPARVARAVSEELPDPARGPAEEAATWVRLFLAHVPLALDLEMCIAWELRAPSPCTCAKWEGQTLGRSIKFPEAQFERLEGGGEHVGRMRCVKCGATFGFEISADYAEVKREVAPLPEQSAFAKEVAAALGGELAFDLATNPMQAIRIGQHCTVRVARYGAFYRISLPLTHPWTVRSREDWTALEPTLQAALAGHRPVLTMADVVASLPREWNVGYQGEAIENEALLYNATGEVNLKQNESSVTVTVWNSGTRVARELTSLDALTGLAEWIRGQVAEQASTRATASAAIIERLAVERASMRVPTLEQVMAALRDGHEIQVGGGRSFVSYAIKRGQLVQVQCDDGSTQDVACSEDRLRQAIAEDPNVFDAVVQRHTGPVN